MSDSQGIGNDPFSCAAAPVEVVRRSGAVGGTAIRPISAVRCSVFAVGGTLGKSSGLGSFGNDGGLVDRIGAPFGRRLASVVTLEPRLRL